MDQQKLNLALIQIYKTLGFTDQEIEKTFEDLTGIQQVATSNELLRILDKNEIESLNGLEQNSGPEMAAVLSRIVEKHQDNPEFSEKLQAAAKRVLDDHIAYLKSRGDDSQKSRIAQILAGVQ